jgi:Domain of unknown function (DUF4432)
VRCIRVDEAEEARCAVRTPLSDGKNIEVAFGFSTSTLPFVKVWENLRANEYVLGIEPCNADRESDGAIDRATPLAGAASRDYRLSISIERVV